MSRLSDNMDLCERAIKETGVTKFTSDNKPFSGFGDVYHFLVNCTRLEENLGGGTSYQIRRADQSLPSPDPSKDKTAILVLLDANGEREVLRQRQLIANIIGSTALSKRQKAKQVKQKMQQLGVSYFRLFDENVRFLWHGSSSQEEARGKDEARARMYGVGNCQEKSATTVNWLTRHNPNKRAIAWVSLDSEYEWKKGSTGDHAFAFFDIDPKNEGKDKLSIADVGDDCVLVDGWTGDWYPAKHPYKFWKSMANPFQMGVRVLIQKFAVGHICFKEWIGNGEQQVNTDTDGDMLDEILKEVTEEIKNNPVRNRGRSRSGSGSK